MRHRNFASDSANSRSTNCAGNRFTCTAAEKVPDSSLWTTEDITGMVSRALELIWMFPLHYFQWTTVLAVCINEWLPLWKRCYWLHSNDDIIRKQK